MTLKELSPLYLESARLISERMSLLRRQRRETDDPQERFRLGRRLLELRPMLTQMNQLAELTADAAQQIAKAPWKPYIALADTAVLTEEGTADA